ncbi:hypothetical protein C7974DRAFT_318045 [Boeremia exigua]|uniref:uncharacterized protein n=1 Tax=Boeremia exigua TaxID=749465 RepID=UPI001E8E9C7D|nr:uncharacterized protein C7974DRAFT_318045 [Boeremia exigua]KAH6618486.1 hypothetical protein C7974DRAFT_318045 [Boeremia exigua]
MAPALLYNDDSEVCRPSTHGICSAESSVAPTIAKLDFQAYKDETILISDIVKSLKTSGGCIVRGMYRQGTLKALEVELRPHIEATKKADQQRENFHGDEARSSVSLPQLSTTVTFSVGPGTKAQGLHRDDDIYHTQHPATSTHQEGRDNTLCLFVAGKKCTKQNGATRIVPGSHLWDFTTPPPSYTKSSEMFAHAEMMPGDAFFMLGGVYHGAGSNTTTKEERLVYAAFATRGYLRQEENQYLANDLSKIAKLPLHIQRFAGFGSSKPYMGWVGDDMEEPVKLLNPDAEMEDPGFW